LNYKTRFVTAYHKSSEVGLEPDCQALPFKKKLSKKKVQEIRQFCIDYLYSIGLTKSSELANKCIPVHMHLQPLIREHLSVESYITIGDKYWDDYVYCKMSYETILQELQDPDVEASLKAHVWLTLRDGSVLDCTGEAHMDLLFNRGDHHTHQCIAYIPSDKPVSDGYYRPYLVGSEFLKRVGAFAIVPA